MHQDVAVRMAASVSGGWGDAEAVAQEALIKAYQGLDRFRPGAPFRPWLLRIVMNEARNARRGGQRRHRLVERAGRALPSTAADSPETELLAADDRRQLLAAVGRLPRRQREAIACRYLLELSEAETAQVLAVATGTVKSRLSRGLQRLRSDLSAAAAPRREEVP